ncbi:FHA domain-containing protein [Candidatus Saccharibacteria bacterium]|nr:FHA domain-containing protein [Candidatus Saccharibacteria bacterium]
MSEQHPSAEPFAIDPHYAQTLKEVNPHKVQMLQGGTYHLDLGGKPLIPKDTARESYWFNGDIIATFALPDDPKEPSEYAKEIAVIDFGADVDETHPATVYLVDGKEAPHIARAKTRYGLMPISYSATHILSYLPLPHDGKPLVIGKGRIDPKSDIANHRLGITDGSKGVDAISRQHLTLQLQDESLTITDHSTNGTMLRLPVEAVDYDYIQAIGKRFGAGAVQAAREKGVLEVNPYPSDN